MHGSSAHRTVPERVSLVAERRRCRGRHSLRAVEQLKAERQQLSAVAVGEEAEVADADETRRQEVEQKTAQELFNSQGHEPLLVAVSRIAPSEGDVATGESDQPGVGDGDAMSVGAEIAQHMFRATEGLLGVDDPVMTVQHS